MNGKHCGGQRITAWNDGSNANYGTLNSLPECIKLCSDHWECAGFVHRTTGNICGLWKRGPLNPIQRDGFNCHKKLAGNNDFTVPLYFKH